MAYIGDRAVVIGASMGGLAAAAALANHFERVVVLDRDTLPSDGVPRSGVPQGQHTHGLLVAGQRALEALLPGIAGDAAAAGAVVLDVTRDVRVERFGFDPFPQRALGIPFSCLSRPALELAVRRRVAARANVELRDDYRVEEVVPTPDGNGVAGVRCAMPGKEVETLSADLVVDASGRGTPTLDFLNATGHGQPTETVIGMDINYATARFAIPSDAPSDWKGIYLFPKAPETGRGCLLLPIEGGNWIVTLFASHDDRPPADDDGFLEFAKGLRAPTSYDAIRSARRLTPTARYRFAGSIWRHFERLADFPRGLLPVGDAMCRFNPIYGQGMSVAAQEALLLHRLFGERGGEADPLAAVRQAYFAELPALLETPWSSAVADLIYPQTTGERPPEFEQNMRFFGGLFALAARDPEVHRLIMEVGHLVKPRSAYRDPALQARVRAVMAEMAPRQ